MDTLQMPHKLTLQDRSSLTVTGVTEVLRFDDTAVLLRTEQGTLEIHGEGLQLKTLSLEGGQMAVDGRIRAMIYEDPQPKGGLFRRLLP